MFVQISGESVRRKRALSVEGDASDASDSVIEDEVPMVVTVEAIDDVSSVAVVKEEKAKNINASEVHKGNKTPG